MTIRSDPGAIRACTEAGVPVRRWQRVQWHQLAETSEASISKRTAPHMQPPVSGSSGTSRSLGRPGDEHVFEVLARPASGAPVDVPAITALESQTRAFEDLGIELPPIVDDDDYRRP